MAQACSHQLSLTWCIPLVTGPGSAGRSWSLLNCPECKRYQSRSVWEKGWETWDRKVLKNQISRVELYRLIFCKSCTDLFFVKNVKNTHSHGHQYKKNIGGDVLFFLAFVSESLWYAHYCMDIIHSTILFPFHWSLPCFRTEMILYIIDTLAVSLYPYYSVTDHTKNIVCLNSQKTRSQTADGKYPDDLLPSPRFCTIEPKDTALSH